MSITYDAMGNPLTDGTWTYTWEHGRQLASMVKSGTTWTYTYDANGMRTGRSNGTDTYTYVYNGGQLVQMTVGTHTLYFTYDAGGTPATVTLDGTMYYYITNLQGDVVAIWDETSNYICDYYYDAWGKVISRSYSPNHLIDDLNPLLYRGYVYDHDINLYYLQSRYYNPEIGRFINADAFASTGQGVLGCNMFTYCGNNPISRNDPTGNAFVQIAYNYDGITDDVFPELGGGGGGGISHSALGYIAVKTFIQDSNVQEMIETVKNISSVENIGDAIEIVWTLIKNELVQDAYSPHKIKNGIKQIGDGLDDILFPYPTLAEDVTGAAKIAFGFAKIVYGVGELFNWLGR